MASEGSTLKLKRNHIGHSNKKELKKESDEREDIYIYILVQPVVFALFASDSVNIKGVVIGWSRDLKGQLADMIFVTSITSSACVKLSALE